MGADGGNNGGYTSANTKAGNGGVGLATYSEWGLATSSGENVSGVVYFCGGGAGGVWTGDSNTYFNVGGYGGGGTPGDNNGEHHATANTGGGGAGAGTAAANAPGGNGGSGIVIVRYTI